MAAASLLLLREYQSNKGAEENLEPALGAAMKLGAH